MQSLIWFWNIFKKEKLGFYSSPCLPQHLPLRSWKILFSLNFIHIYGNVTFIWELFFPFSSPQDFLGPWSNLASCCFITGRHEREWVKELKVFANSLGLVHRSFLSGGHFCFIHHILELTANKRPWTETVYSLLSWLGMGMRTTGEEIIKHPHLSMKKLIRFVNTISLVELKLYVILCTYKCIFCTFTYLVYIYICQCMKTR